MNKISYEKCICFILLVILVILSCSGFPTDRVAMSRNSKNKFPSSNSSRHNFLDRVFNLKGTDQSELSSSHKLRHLGQLRAPTRNTRSSKLPMGHIEAIVIPNDDDSPITSERFSRLSSFERYHPLASTQIINSRSQRSSNHLRHCHHEHYSVKAFKAQIVLHVRAMSHGKKKRSVYSVYFQVLKKFKNSPFPIHQRMMLEFSNSTKNCEKERRGRRNLVRADIRAFQEYILFLNVSSNENLTPVAVPEIVNGNNKGKIMKILNKVCSSNFKLKRTRIAKLEDKSKRKRKRRNRIKLVCRAANLPIPQITWRRDNVTITNSTHIRIKYVERRSTLVIRDATENDFGRYECVARGVDGVTDSKSIEVRRSPTRPTPSTSETISRKKCDHPYDKEFCLNNGQCFMDLYPLQRYCECPNGFQGERCLEKTSYQPASMYPQTPLYTCKLGLSTKYYC